MMTTSNGSVVHCSTVRAPRSRTDSTPRYTRSAGRPRINSIIANKIGTFSIVVDDESSESRSNWTPLTMKNTGIRNPNPIAPSRGDSASDCSLLSARWAMIPAANAPSRLSRPSREASITITVTSSRMMRTGSCVDVERCRCIISMNFGGCCLVASAATTTATPAKAISRMDSVAGLLALSRSVIATIGPNSPTAPAAVMNDPNGESSI